MFPAIDDYAYHIDGRITPHPSADSEQRRCDTASIGADRLLVADSGDVAIAVAAAAAAENENERNLVSKLDRRGLWILISCYTFALLDRANLGGVKPQISEDIGLTEEGYSLASSVFFVTYIPLSIPANVLAQRYGTRPVLSLLMVGFGAVGTCQMLATGLSDLVAIRLVLGVTEAGVYPAVALFISLWYKPSERGRRFGYFQFASPISGMLGGLIAWGLVPVTWQGLAGWQLLFLVEGTPAVLLGVVAWFVLPDEPAATAWLTAAETRIATTRVPTTNAATVTAATFNTVICDPKTWLFALLFLASTAMGYTLSFYTPEIIVKGMGASLATANLLAVPISAVNMLSLYLMMQWSDWSGQRWLCAATAGSGCTVGFGMVLAGDHFELPPLGYAGLFFAVSGATALIPITIAWLTDALKKGPEIAVYTAVVVSVGNLGGIVGPQVYGLVGQYMRDENDEADYRIAHAVMAGLGLLVIVISLILKFATEAAAATTPVASAGSFGEDEPLLNGPTSSKNVDA